MYGSAAGTTYAPISVMHHLPPTGHRWGLDQLYDLIPIPQGMLIGLMAPRSGV